MKLQSVLLLGALAAVLASCGDAAESAATESFDIAVFIPGVVEGSPTYELLVAGVEAAAAARENAGVRVVEGGFNQGEWENGLLSLAETGTYELIVSANPSLPDLAANVTEFSEDARFLILDGYLEGNPAIATIAFNQREQAFLAGYYAGLVTSSDMEQANPELRVGLLAGQEFPVMNDVIRPGYLLGARTAVPSAELDFRVLGNWFDAAGAADIARSMIDSGVDVILTIAGSANEGVVAAAREAGAYALWFDRSGYEVDPDIVAGSTQIALDRAAEEAVLSAIDGELDFGTARVLGVAEGYVDFDTEARAFQRIAPQEIQDAMNQMRSRLQDGELDLSLPLP